MVVHTSNSSGKNDGKVPLKSDMEAFNRESFTAGRKRRSNCPLATSIIFNVALISLLVASGVFLCRFRRKICKMDIKHQIEMADLQGLDYQVNHEACEITLENQAFPDKLYDGLAYPEKLREMEDENDETGTVGPKFEVTGEPYPRPRHGHHHRHHHRGHPHRGHRED